MHCHSKLSDGSTRIEDIIKLAEKSGIQKISITDHDTFDGVIKAQAYTGSCGVELVPGIEISALDNKSGKKVHVLGYMCDTLKDLTAMCNNTLLSRYRAGCIMIDKIKKDYNITYKMVERYSSESTCIYKQHIMNALMDAGYATSIYCELYNNLFNKRDGIAYEPIKYPEVREVVRLINDAGGISVIAHCSEFDSFDLIKELVDNNSLDGVEVWHPLNTEVDKTRLMALSKEKGLLMTGGTDFHGAYSNISRTLGTMTTPDEQFERMQLRKSQKL